MNHLRKLRRVGCIVLIVGIIASCSSQVKKTSGSPEWNARMQLLSHSLSVLMPFVVSSSQFNRSENLKTIEEQTAVIADLVHQIDMAKMVPDVDPSLRFVARKFSKDMIKAKEELRYGNREYARYLIRNTANYCISCHTRRDSGRRDMALALQPDLSDVSLIDQAQYYASVRHFDKAIQKFDEMLTDSKSGIEDPFGWELAAKKALAITVRVKRSPHLSLELVSRLRDSKAVPSQMKAYTKQWRKSIKDWISEEKKLGKAAHFDRKAKLKHARRLFMLAQKTPDYPMGSAGLIYYLRASTLLHDILSSPAKDRTYGAALFYAGSVAEALRDINLWTLHEAYYEACIRHQPKTKLARKCYVRYETLQFKGYSEYQGVIVPVHVREHLSELKGLAGISAVK